MILSSPVGFNRGLMLACGWFNLMLTNSTLPRPRRFLSADGLIETLRSRFDLVPDRRRSSDTDYSMGDALMSAFAMFSLKDPSLLAFQQRAGEPLIHKLYGINAIPSDTQMRGKRPR